MKVKLDYRPDGIYNGYEDDDRNPKNLLNNYIKEGNKQNVKGIIDLITNDLVSFTDTYNSIIICKEELYKKFQDLYVELIKNLSSNQKEFKYDITKNELPYLAITRDSSEEYMWITQVARLENNDIINRIIDSDKFPMIENSLVEFFDFYILTGDIWMNDLGLDNDQQEKLISDCQNIEEKYSSGIKSISSIVPWKAAAKIGNDGLLTDIINKGLEWHTFDSEIIQILIDYKWNVFGRICLIYDLIIHISLLITFSAYCIFNGYNTKFEPVNIGIQVPLLFLSWLLSSYNLYKEAIQVSWIFDSCQQKNETIAFQIFKIMNKWFYSKWNSIELLMYTFISFIIPILQIIAYSKKECTSVSLNNIASVTVGLLWWKSLFYMLPFEKTGPLVNMIFEVLKDLGVFLIVVIVIMVGFSTMFFGMISSNNGNNEIVDIYFNSFPLSLVRTFGMMLGDFDLDTFTNSSNISVLSTSFFMLYMFLMMVVFLNLLIAIMGDTFDRVKPKQVLSFYVARCHIITDIEFKMIRSQQQMIK